MAGNHPGNAAYVSADGLVSFDRYGRKLDSGGRVVAGDRQRAGDAGASPIQRREEQPKGPPAQNPAAQYTFPTNATGLPVQRSGWDNSPIPPAQGAASVAGVSGAGRGNNPNTLAPGGIDNSFLGLPYPTARNGLLGSAWAKPWRGGQSAAAPGNIQMQTGGLNVAPDYSKIPAANMPYPPTGDDRVRIAPRPGDGMMYDPYGGNYNGNLSDTYQQSSYEQTPMVPVPGFGMLPDYVSPDVPEVAPQQQWQRAPNILWPPPGPRKTRGPLRVFDA